MGVCLTTVVWRTEPLTKDFSSTETCCWTGGLVGDICTVTYLYKAGSLASPEVGVARKIFQTYFFVAGGASAILEYSVQSLTGLKQTGSNTQRSAITRRKMPALQIQRMSHALFILLSRGGSVAVHCLLCNFIYERSGS